MSYIKLHTEVKDGVQTISRFDTNGNVVEQDDLTIILHALSRTTIEEKETAFAYTFGMSF